MVNVTIQSDRIEEKFRESRDYPLLLHDAIFLPSPSPNQPFQFSISFRTLGKGKLTLGNMENKAILVIAVNEGD